MGVNEFDFEDKELEKIEVNTSFQVKKAELKRIQNLLKLKDSPDIVKFLENFLLHKYGVIGKLSDKEMETNRSFYLKGRLFQLREIIHWQISLENEIKKIKGEVSVLERRLQGDKPEHEPEA